MNDRKISSDIIEIMFGTDIRLKRSSDEQQLKPRSDDTNDKSEDMNEDTAEDINDLILRPNVSEVIKDNCVEPMNGLNIEKHTLVNNTSNPLTSQSLPQEMVNEEIIDISNEDSMEDSMQPKLLTEFLPQSVRRSERSKPLARHAVICPPKAGQKTFNLLLFSDPTTQEMDNKEMIRKRAKELAEKVKLEKLLNQPIVKHSVEDSAEKMPSNERICPLDINERKQCYDLKSKTFICPINECHKSFRIDVSFRKHFLSDHTGRQYVCDYEGCGKVFKVQSGLTQHSLIHKTIKSFKCDFNGCQYRGVSRQHLRQHLKTHLITERVFKCDVSGCGKAYKHRSDLLEHQRTHNTEPTYKCGTDGCSDMFHSPHQRTKHQVMVHNRQPYTKRVYKHRCQWPGCDWMGTSLKVHQSVHTGAKPYACDWPDCGKRFRVKDKLDNHLNVHNNVKPYACQWPGYNVTVMCGILR
ncbi:unnamed protein product [Medioppia subpectinata]|uniref:C2H2-type domain-containing protein n=1 Tax=Medioppia subpectinata TaxID=1979941 RepID=A0A7R9L3X3_9ACAR|nr:unnamed protein product [Medioppia subpectinata]CAG2114854.1 unnamed protein product [Medioppia subpectinata]